MIFSISSKNVLFYPFLWRILIFILLVMFFCIVIIIPLVQKNQQAQIEKDLLIQAKLAAILLKKPVEDREYVRVNEILLEVFATTKSGVTLITSEKRVFFQRESDALSVENLFIREEIQKAKIEGSGTAFRFNSTYNTNIVYSAVKIMHSQNGGYSILRLSLPVETHIISLFVPNIPLMIFGFLVIVVIAVYIFYEYSRRIFRPIERLSFVTDSLFPEIKKKEHSARRTAVFMFSEIDHSIRVLYSLSKQMKELAGRDLHRQLWSTSILAGMTEGVLAVDMDFQILVMNQALADMFHVTRTDFIGKRVEKVFAGMSIVNFLEEIFEQQKLIDKTLTILEAQDRYLQVIGTPLFNQIQENYGALLVIHDVTQLRRLELVRKEFASNVSHELKTPLTSIKGYVETMSDDSSLDEEERARFLSVVKKQTDRVIAIVEDLLQLSSIEKDLERNLLSFEETSLNSLVRDAVEVCTVHASQKHIKIRIDSKIEITGKLHPHLFEQAIVNLIDNAIKYSDDDSTVTVSIGRKPGEIFVSVKDTGCGIQEKHLPRLFERFYRVDKARSRDMGGTGLGLAIVKHIVQAHQGRFTVESEVGMGSTFTLCLPD